MPDDVRRSKDLVRWLRNLTHFGIKLLPPEGLVGGRIPGAQPTGSSSLQERFSSFSRRMKDRRSNHSEVKARTKVSLVTLTTMRVGECFVRCEEM